jgi:hypothetical protein
MREAIEETVQKRSDDLDSRIVEWTFNSLTRDHEFERFFAAIPDFCDSRAVREPKFHLLALNDKQEEAVTDFVCLDVPDTDVSSDLGAGSPTADQDFYEGYRGSTNHRVLSDLATPFSRRGRDYWDLSTLGVLFYAQVATRTTHTLSSVLSASSPSS